MRIKNKKCDEGIGEYLKSIEKYKPLSMKEEQELGRKIKSGNKAAMDILVKRNLKFVVSIAKRYTNRGVPLSDLIAEGNAGLIHAASKYDGSKNVKFITYAVWWVKYYITECIKKYKIVTETSVDDFFTANSTAQVTENSIINEEFEEELVSLQSRRASVDELLKCLHDREIKILTMFYGLDNKKEMTLEEVGKEMNITMERVRQIKDEAITKLKCVALTMDKLDLQSIREMA